MPTYLTMSRGRYHFAIGIPERHRPTVRARWPKEFTGATTIRRALGTSDPREAARRAAPLITLWTERLAELEAGASAWSKAREELAHLGVTLSPARPVEVEEGLDAVPQINHAAFTANAFARTAWLQYERAREELLRSLPPGMRVDFDGALAPMRAEIEERNARIFEALEPVGGPAPRERPSAELVTFDAAVKRWKADRSPSAGSVAQVAGVAKRWAAYFGSRCLTEIAKRDVLAWRQSMQAAGDVSPQRINVIVGFAGAVLAAAEAAGMIETNPAHRLRALTPTGTGRDAFTADEVAKLLKHADGMPDQGAAWLIRLGAYTGARLHEIAQLTHADIVDDGEILAIDINGKNGKTIKNKGSWRTVPIHADVADKLRAFVKDREGRLFWAEGDASAPMGLEITASGVRREGVCFHSLRHTFKNLCREAQIPEEVHDSLTGHSGGGVGRRYGGRPPLRVLADAVAKLKFPKVADNT
ncbi:DUF6538 domain-containing protein [Azospirillum sp. B510]|uniref:DUF6538 domain-containing protein n=1 Tax=Azospirillum sp. (strain B510) TaxID=137722 RepID=UPI0005AA8385|nr:DUF6538 domain-containing protein [Azospirillum sp. B510]